jgi:hypothetical protein
MTWCSVPKKPVTGKKQPDTVPHCVNRNRPEAEKPRKSIYPGLLCFVYFNAGKKVRRWIRIPQEEISGRVP